VLIQRGSITFWLDDPALNRWWYTQDNGRRDRDLTYSDKAIQRFLMLQAVYGVNLRKTEGFINSLLALMGAALTGPDHRRVSKRAKKLQVNIPKLNGVVGYLMLDGTGLKVYGER
jgi:hypothetical protein